MKKTYRFAAIISVIAAILGMMGCDKIDNPRVTLNNQYLEGVYGPPPTFNFLENPKRNVLFEEFTGHVCGFCPPATAQAKAWSEEYGDRFVAVSIHAGSLSEPGEAPFETDYRTPTGDFYWSQLDGGFNPAARIDRDQGNAVIYGFAQWPPIVQARLNTAPEAALQMITSYDAQNRNVNIHVHAQFLESLSNDVRIVILVDESNIISAQEDYNLTPSEVLDYKHDHVLRDAVTSPDGWFLIASPRANDALTKSFTYPLNADWNEENCAIVAYLIESNTGKILNTVRRNVIE